MKGVLLESSEFAYLLACLHATQVVGLETPELFPEDPADRDALIEAGGRQLQSRGWLKRLEHPAQFDLSVDLMVLAAVVADPEFVIFTIRAQPNRSSRVLLHYLAEPDIVELQVTVDGKYALTTVPDRGVLVGRIQEMLELKPVGQEAQAAFTIEEPTFQTIQDLVEEGQADEAAELLRQAGVNGANGDLLLKALQTPETGGLVVVVRPRRGQVEAGRKASVFRGVDVVWLAKRVDATSKTFSVETVMSGTLPDVLETYLKFLAQK
jgi:hypothetical protein